MPYPDSFGTWRRGGALVEHVIDKIHEICDVYGSGVVAVAIRLGRARRWGFAVKHEVDQIGQVGYIDHRRTVVIDVAPYVAAAYDRIAMRTAPVRPDCPQFRTVCPQP